MVTEEEKIMNIFHEYPKTRDSRALLLYYYLLKHQYPTESRTKNLEILKRVLNVDRIARRIQNTYKIFRASPKVERARQKYAKIKAKEYAS